MPIVRHALAPALLLALVALPAAGSAQARGTRDTVPLQLLPPAGKCRIWMEGVPAAQQPAPTDCSTALRQKPSNGVVLYGPAPRDAGTERFDPKGASAANPNLERGGSAAEQDLRKQRVLEERRRRMQELRERDERVRRETEERALVGRTRTAGGSTPAAPRTGSGTAVPRASTTGNSTEPTRPSTPAEPASKAPPEGKRKPE